MMENQTQPLAWNNSQRPGWDVLGGDKTWAAKMTQNWRLALIYYNKTMLPEMTEEEQAFMKELMETISIAEGGKINYDTNDNATLAQRGEESWVAWTGAGGRHDRGVFGTALRKKTTLLNAGMGQVVNKTNLRNHGALLEGIYRACIEVEQGETSFLESKWVQGMEKKYVAGGGDRSTLTLERSQKLFNRSWEKFGDKKSINLSSKVKDCESLTTKFNSVTD